VRDHQGGAAHHQVGQRRLHSRSFPHRRWWLHQQQHRRMREWRGDRQTLTAGRRKASRLAAHSVSKPSGHFSMNSGGGAAASAAGADSASSAPRGQSRILAAMLPEKIPAPCDHHRDLLAQGDGVQLGDVQPRTGCRRLDIEETQHHWKNRGLAPRWDQPGAQPRHWPR